MFGNWAGSAVGNAVAISRIAIATADLRSHPAAGTSMRNSAALSVWTETREFIAALVLLLIANLVAAAGPKVDVGGAVFFTIVPGTAMLITRRVVRERQLLADALAARAELLEREQAMREQEAVAEERARIALGAPRPRRAQRQRDGRAADSSRSRASGRSGCSWSGWSAPGCP
jgi:signal transduction histidine kinase